MDIKEQLATWERLQAPDDLRRALMGVDARALTPGVVTRLARLIDKFAFTPSVRVAYLSNFVVDLLPPYVKIALFGQGLASDHYIGAYNQFFQEVLTPAGPFERFQPDVVLLFLAMRDLEPQIAHHFTALTMETRRHLLDALVQRVEEWVHQARQRSKAQLLVANFAPPAYPQQGVADLADPLGEGVFYQVLNTRLAETFSGSPDVQLLDLAKLTTRFGADNVLDPKLYYMAKMLWSERFLPVVADEVLRTLMAVRGLARKCLVVDLDNTLWGGVVGEEGPHGVKVGVGDAVSEAFLDFQLRLKALKDRGVMLAICSKNNESDVREVFALRPEMPLRLEDFAASRINWNPKGQNIRELAVELNIGLESMVFIDDNPAECSLVRDMVPEVLTLQVPPQPENMPAMIDRLPVFEKRAILAADREKTTQYIQNRQRQQLREQVTDLGFYLHSLETKVAIRRPLKEDLERVHQLFAKTNQFNATTKRYTPAEIDDLYKDPTCDLFVTDATDKFGNLGTIGLYLVRVTGNGAEVDSFIMSCRAMGRGIESAIMNHLKERCFAVHNADCLRACYLPTRKNKPIETFFDDQGFSLQNQKSNGAKHYLLNAHDNRPADCPWIQIVRQEDR